MKGILSGEGILQIGLVVEDAEKSAKLFADLTGEGPPSVIVTEGSEKTDVRYRGEPTEGRAKLAFVQSGKIMVEFIEPIGGPSTWKEFLDSNGPGIHHVGMNIQGMKTITKALEGMGIKEVQKGEFSGGRYSYLDGTSSIGMILELLEND